MKRYIALLRGVNISGKNKVPMAKLKKCFESLGFSAVKTILNSGNVIFSGGEADAAELTGRIECMIRREFGLDIPAFVIPQEDLADILRHAPAWWGTENKEIYDNLIFILPPAAFSDVYHEIGEPKEGLERWAFMPASRQRFASSSKALAVRAMMGISAASLRGSARMARAAAMPSITGIMISVRMASKVSAGAAEKLVPTPTGERLKHELTAKRGK